MQQLDEQIRAELPRGVLARAAAATAIGRHRTRARRRRVHAVLGRRAVIGQLVHVHEQHVAVPLELLVENDDLFVQRRLQRERKQCLWVERRRGAQEIEQLATRGAELSGLVAGRNLGAGAVDPVGGGQKNARTM